MTGHIDTAYTTSGTPGRRSRSPPEPSDATALRAVISRTMKSRGLCRLHEDEWPMLDCRVCAAGPFQCVNQHAAETVWYGGHANQLSTEEIAYPRIDAIHSATKLSNGVPRHLRRRAGSQWLRRDQAASSSFIDARLWRGRPNAAFGARLCGWNAIDVLCAALGRPCGGDRSRFLPILPARVSSSSICTSIASTGWNPACTGSGRGCRIGADQEWRPARCGRGPESRAGSRR